MIAILAGPGEFSIAASVFWASLTLIAYVYVGYPLVLLLASALRRHPDDAPPDYTPNVSVIIACYNEEAAIATKVRQTLALDYPGEKLEVIVVSDGSTDSTAEIVEGIRDPRLRLIRIRERRGKTHAQNVAVAVCNGDCVIFSDATTVYEPNALRYLAAHYRDPRVGAVSGRYRYVAGDKRKMEMAWGAMLFWNYENLLKRLQSRAGTLTGCSGCIYSVRRNLYQALDETACSDLVEPLCIVRQGYRVVFEPRALAFEEATDSSGDEFRMRVRVVSQGILSIARMSELLKIWTYGWTAFQLLSHKVLRWTVPVLLVGLFASCAALLETPAYRACFAIQLGFYLYAGLSLRIPFHKAGRIFALPLYFCVLNAAVVYSVLEIWRGKQFTVWETVRRRT